MHVCIRYTRKRMRRNSLITVCRSVLVLSVALPATHLIAQLPTSSGVAPLPRAESVINRSTDPYSGSIVQGKATSETLDLTVVDALDRGLKDNLGLLLSSDATAETRALRLQSLSRLLPNINGAFAEELQRLNLKAFGFKFAGLPSSVGPFRLTVLP